MLLLDESNKQNKQLDGQVVDISALKEKGVIIH
jgi:hypothetical protein